MKYLSICDGIGGWCLSLVVTHAHFPSSNRAFAVLTISPHFFSAPSVFGGSVPLHSLVVHEAKSVGGVALFAALYSACFHVVKVNNSGPRYKALGNSWAVPVVNWIGQRIDEVEAIKAVM